jgi:hypothetical protein
MARQLLWALILCGCAFDLSALGPEDGGFQDGTVDSQVEDADVSDATLADADLDSGTDSGLEDSGIDGGTIDDGGSDTGVDAYVCERATEDSSDIGFECSRCTGQPGYTCLGSGALFSCQVLCTEDCNCPVGWECRMAGTGDFICQN